MIKVIKEKPELLRDTVEKKKAVVYLCRDTVDFRKGINGLAVLVEETLQLDPFSEHLFVFCNRRRNRIKILYWERNGFCLWQKRLERDRFAWPFSCFSITLSS